MRTELKPQNLSVEFKVNDTSYIPKEEVLKQLKNKDPVLYYVIDTFAGGEAKEGVFEVCARLYESLQKSMWILPVEIKTVNEVGIEFNEMSHDSIEEILSRMHFVNPDAANIVIGSLIGKAERNTVVFHAACVFYRIIEKQFLNDRYRLVDDNLSFHQQLTNIKPLPSFFYS